MRKPISVGIGAVAIAALAFMAWSWGYVSTTPGDLLDQDQVAFGGRVYGRICAQCHGANLAGQLGWRQPLKDGTRLAPAHDRSGRTWRRPDETLFDVVKYGGDYLKPDGGLSRMPAFDKKLTDDEIWSVIAFIKSNWPSKLQQAQQSAGS